jgi:glucuronate isomerase
MNRAFLHEDFLLGSGIARRLYHEIAAPLPIIDYHCHLDAARLASNEAFENLTQLWVASDPYKHRAMRMAGVPERLITGDASDREKFDAWALVCPQTLGGPLFPWSALELKRFFDIDQLLTPDTAARIWHHCQAQLSEPDFRPRALLERTRTSLVCTSNALGDDLSAHELLAAKGESLRVIPSPRDPDHVDGTRLDAFDTLGCRIADHSATTIADLDGVLLMAREYARRGWTLQLHLGAQRETSSRLRHLAGPAGGYATIGNSVDVPGLCRFLDALEQTHALPRMILYPLNPSDYPALATLTGSFAEDAVPGKIQLGPAWWFNDHEWGIRQHLDALAQYGLLATFIGMTTDSRSLLSMVRHEMFRRILCDWIGGQVASGRFPEDEALLGTLVRRLCHDNAASFVDPPQTNSL